MLFNSFAFALFLPLVWILYWSLKSDRLRRGLLVVATVSPLVGVLGTIQGLIGFYSQPGLLEGKAPTLAMSDAVFQALLSSALGLSIAIPAYLFYCYLASRARQVVHSLERAGTEAVCLVCDARQRREDGERMAGREA